MIFKRHNLVRISVFVSYYFVFIVMSAMNTGYAVEGQSVDLQDTDCENSFALITDGEPTATFVVTGNQAETKISCAIQDFNEDLKECAGGAELPVTDTDDGINPVIRFTVESRKLFDEDRFAVTFPDSRTMLITGTAYSIRWALNHILEKFAGVRWLARSKNSAHFPQIADLAVPRVEIKMAPSFNLHREVYVPDAYWFDRSYNKWGLRFSHDLIVVVFPVKKYMAENKWPEFIFPTIKGKKFLPYLPGDDPIFKKPEDYSSGWQPCLTSKETVDEAVKNICGYFDKNPDDMSVSLAVNDMGNFCQCKNCKKLGGLKRAVMGHLDYSELYYTWINQIVEEVAKKHPDKYFGLLAYREVITPPGFKLHKNIIPFICFDGQPCMPDREVMASRLALLKGWSEKASNVGWWEYGWGACMDLPRVYFGCQQEMMKIAHTNNVRAMFVEAEGAIEDGPKKYVYNKLMWDVNADLNALLKDWYEACVGFEAAPYLSEYFRFWEKFWREEAVKTEWFDSRKATYMSQADKTYLYAVGHEDMPKMRKLMEKVVELAGKHGDRRQQLRAGWMMREFEYSEACVYAIGGHIFPYSGIAENAEQALKYLTNLTEAVKYDLKRKEIFEERKADPDLGKGGFSDFYGFYVPGALAGIAPFCSDPRVMKAFREAAKKPELNAETRGLCDIFVKLESNQPVDNLLKDGSFENGNADAWINGRVTSERDFRGKNSLKLELDSPRVVIVAAKDKIPANPTGESYLMSAMIYVNHSGAPGRTPRRTTNRDAGGNRSDFRRKNGKTDHPDDEEYVKITGYAFKNGKGSAAWSTPKIRIKPKKWTRVSLVANVKPDMDAVALEYIIFENFSKGDVAYVDDIIIAPLGRERQNAGNDLQN